MYIYVYMYIYIHIYALTHLGVAAPADGLPPKVDGARVPPPRRNPLEPARWNRGTSLIRNSRVIRS